MENNELKFDFNLKKPEKKIFKQESDDEEEEQEVDYKEEINKNIKRQQEYNAQRVKITNCSSQMIQAGI